MNDYRKAGEKVRTWLDVHFDAEGRCVIDPDEARYYPKVPYLLNAAGLRAKGARSAKWVLEHFIDDEGNLTGPGAEENRVYGMGWLLLGAVVVERFDLAGALAGRLCEMQDGLSGGIALMDEDVGEEV